MLFEVEFSFNRDYQLFKSIEKRREADILKFSALIIITSREVIKARYSVILNQSERAHLYNRWAIKLKAFIRRIRSCFTNVCYIASRSLFSFCWRPHTILITTTQALIPIVFKYRLTMKSFLHCKCLHYFLLVPIDPIGYFQYFYRRNPVFIKVEVNQVSLSRLFLFSFSTIFTYLKTEPDLLNDVRNIRKKSHNFNHYVTV